MFCGAGGKLVSVLHTLMRVCKCRWQVSVLVTPQRVEAAQSGRVPLERVRGH